MIAFKGFNKSLECTKGKGIYQFAPGGTYQEEGSKTASAGFHCCENPLECLAYYPLGMGNRYFKVEAAGSIDEDDGERIACTELTLLEELTTRQLAGYGMAYMVQHPKRAGWQQDYKMCRVAQGQTEAEAEGAIAIGRGPKPMAKGPAGAILGLVCEPNPGEITAARLFCVEEGQQEKWWTLNGMEIMEVKANEA